MQKLKFIGLFVCGLVAGGIAVGLWSGHLFSKMMVSKQVEAAFQAAQQAEWLAELRLNEPEAVIRDMENSMNIQVAAIAVWNGAAPADEKTRVARDNFLTAVKVYHESYPVAGPDAGCINALLDTVPGRSPLGTCKSGICRLDDQRLASSNTKTNSP